MKYYELNECLHKEEGFTSTVMVLGCRAFGRQSGLDEVMMVGLP